MAMPINMIFVMYVILCILSYDFYKLTILYIHAHIFYISVISMTNKSVMTLLLSIKYLSVCLIPGVNSKLIGYKCCQVIQEKTQHLRIKKSMEIRGETVEIYVEL